MTSDLYWVGGTGTWTTGSSSHWASTSGGTGPNTPTTDGIAHFDANSGTGTVTINHAGGIGLGKLIMSDSSAITLAGSGTTGALTVNGDVSLGANVTYTNSSTFTWGPYVSSNFTSNGKSWAGPFDSNLNGLSTGSTVSFTDDFLISGTFTFTGGYSGVSVFQTLGNFTVGNYVSTDSPAITLTPGKIWTFTGSGTIAVFSPDTVFTNSDLTTFKIAPSGSVTFDGGDLTFGDLWYAPGGNAYNLIIQGANTFADFKDDGTAAHIVTLPASSTTTVGTFTVSGNSGNLISLRSSTSGTLATISQTSGTISRNYLDIKDSAATGEATWYAGANSIDTGNNTGWIFSSPPTTGGRNFAIIIT